MVFKSVLNLNIHIQQNCSIKTLHCSHQSHHSLLESLLSESLLFDELALLELLSLRDRLRRLLLRSRRSLSRSRSRSFLLALSRSLFLRGGERLCLRRLSRSRSRSLSTRSLSLSLRSRSSRRCLTLRSSER